MWVARGDDEIAFTSFSALRTQLLDDLAAGKVLTSAYSIGGRSISFRSLKEVTDYLATLDVLIKAEGGGGYSYAAFKERPSTTE